MDVLKIGGVEYAPYIESKGLGWKRNDLDSDQTGRTLDGVMHRAKIGTKRTLSYKLFRISRAMLAALDDALSASTLSVTYLDLHGVQTRTFYCSSFSATGDLVDGTESFWSDASFTLIEV